MCRQPRRQQPGRQLHGEETVPAGYHVVGSDTQSGIAVSEGTCSSGPAKVSFKNMPLTDVSISVNSQVDGGTASTVDCDNNALDGSTNASGDVTTSTTDQEPDRKSTRLNS